MILISKRKVFHSFDHYYQNHKTESSKEKSHPYFYDSGQTDRIGKKGEIAGDPQGHDDGQED